MITEPCCEHCEDGCFLKAGLIRDHIFECEQCYDARHVTITISREDAEAIIAGPKRGKAFRDASAREYDAICAALEKDNH